MSRRSSSTRRIRRRQEFLAGEDRVGAGHEAERLRFVREREPPGREPHARGRRRRSVRRRSCARVRSGSRSAASASGVPGVRTSTLTGRLSGCGSSRPSCASIAQRSRGDSPMPTMPPQQTLRPASCTCSQRVEPILVGPCRDDLRIELRRRVEIVVVRGQARRLQPLGLFGRQHAERGADLHAERRDVFDHVEHGVERRRRRAPRARPPPCRTASSRCRAPSARPPARRRGTSARRAPRRCRSARSADSTRNLPDTRPS